MKYILILLCALFAAILFYQFNYYSNNDVRVDTGSIELDDGQSISAVNKSLKSIRAYSEIIKRPLFSKNRKPPAILSGDTAESIDIGELKGLTLYGVVISSDDRYAILNDKSDSAEHIRVGHVYKGWKVGEINADSVMFESAKGQYELFIAPNDTNKKNTIKKSYKTNVNVNTPSDKPAARRQSIYRSLRKSPKSPMVINDESYKTKPEKPLSQEELDEIKALGEVGAYRYDPDEDLEDEEDLEYEDDY